MKKKVFIIMLILPILFSACSKDNGDSGASPDVNKQESVLTVTGTVPKDGATWIDTASDIIIDFNEPVDAASVSGEAVTIRDGSGVVVTGNITVKSNEIKFKPAEPLKNNEKYTLKIGSLVKSSDGKNLLKDTAVSFMTVKEINIKESAPLQDEMKKLCGKDAFITLVASRSSKYLDWSSPAKLIGSAGLMFLMDQLLSSGRGIGHVQVAYGMNGFTTGSAISGQVSGQENDLIKSGFGVTALTNMIFTDGRLQNEKQIWEKFNDHKGDNDLLAWVTFIVDKDSIDKIEEFVAKFKTSEYRGFTADKNFGFPVDPKKYEGGGCSSYGNAILWASGIDFPIIDKWYRTVYFPFELMGYIDDKTMNSIPNTFYVSTGKIPERKVDGSIQSIWDIIKITPSLGKWADPSKGHKFDMYDPELFYRACVILENIYLQDNKKKSKELCPKGYYCNDKNDTAFTDMFSKELKVYYEKHKAKMKQGSINGVTGVVVDLRK